MGLLRRPCADHGVLHDVSPQDAGWRYVGFRVVRLAIGESYRTTECGREACLVVLTGTCEVAGIDWRFEAIGERNSVFAGPPTSVYVPPDVPFQVTAITSLEFAICTAPAHGDKPVRLIGPEDVGRETRGTGTNTRYVANILADTSNAAEALLVVEVLTPGGNWSSYPPHKHDRDAFPEETLLEETYYHRLDPPQGFAVQRVYTDDRSLDETIAVRDRDVVLVPRGYHPVGAAHGYDLYYLNVMAGPRRAWRFTNDPAHEWMIKG